MAIVIELSGDQEQRLREAAESLGVSPDHLAMAAVSDLIMRPASEFDIAARRVLEKNQKLYQRLATAVER